METRGKVISGMFGYVIGVMLTGLAIFMMVVEVQAREDEENEREMLRTRDWDDV